MDETEHGMMHAISASVTSGTAGCAAVRVSIRGSQLLSRENSFNAQRFVSAFAQHPSFHDSIS